jgi:hypothetical protein
MLACAVLTLEVANARPLKAAKPAAAKGKADTEAAAEAEEVAQAAARAAARAEPERRKKRSRLIKMFKEVRLWALRSRVIASQLPIMPTK